MVDDNVPVGFDQDDQAYFNERVKTEQLFKIMKLQVPQTIIKHLEHRFRLFS